jgi:hypothetical protein
VTQYYYETQTDNYVLRKYNPNTESYFTINDHTIEDVTVNGSQALRVTFEVTDGGELDVDGEANGEIIDPAGPALQQTSPNSPIDESEEPIISDGLLANTGTRVMIAALLAAGSAGTALFLLKQRDTAS